MVNNDDYLDMVSNQMEKVPANGWMADLSPDARRFAAKSALEGMNSDPNYNILDNDQYVFPPEVDQKIDEKFEENEEVA